MSSITREAVLQMDLKSIFAAIKDPQTGKEMQALLKDRAVASRVSELMIEAQNREAEVDAELARTVPPSTEELAAQAAEMVAAPTSPNVPEEVVPATEAPIVAGGLEAFIKTNADAEDAALKTVGVVVVRDAKGVPTRYVQEYQVRDEDGTPIGRPTHLEARTIPELIAKKQDAHVNATRAFHRLKKQKLTFKSEKTILTPEEIAEAARMALESKDPSKASDVIREVIEREYQQREHKLREQKDFEDGRAISNEFMRRHLHDYNPCEANQKAIGEYFRDHNLDFTLDNLEVAFQDLLEQSDKLAKVEPVATVPAIVAANPAPVAAVVTPVTPVIPVAETPTTVPASVVAPPTVSSQPVVEATVTTPAAPNQQPAARRPGVNGSLPPGTLSAQRPGTPDPALARKDFLKIVRDMKPEIMKAKLKNDPQFVKQLESYGIKVR